MAVLRFPHGLRFVLFHAYAIERFEMKRVLSWLALSAVLFCSCSAVPHVMGLKTDNYFVALFFSWLIAGATPAAFLWVPQLMDEDEEGRSYAPIILSLVCLAVTIVAGLYTLHFAR